MISRDAERYFSGEALYGDDFEEAEIAAWFEDEREGYAELGSADEAAYSYKYHALNSIHGFRHLPAGRIGTAVGLGAAYGHEFRPILSRLDRLIIVEPSEVLRRPELDGRSLEHVAPTLFGDLPLADGTADLVTAFDVLHHIPNVSHVVSEVARVLRRGGYALVREPIVSMGDWRQPRRGLTKRERGIPLAILHRIVGSAGLSIAHRALYGTPLMPRLVPDWANSRRAVAIDAVLAHVLAWNLRYHAVSLLQKIRPTSAFLVLRRA